MSQASSAVGTVEDLETVVDLDFHVPQPVERIGPYLEEPYRSYLSGANGAFSDDHWSPPSDDLFRTLGGKVGRGRYDRVEGLEDHRDALDDLGLDHALLTPGLVAKFGVYSNRHFTHALTRAINDRMLEEYVHEDDRFKGVVSLSPHYPDVAAEEVRRVGSRDDVVAAYMSSHLYPALGNRKYWPIFEALVEEDLPLMLHGATSAMPSANPWIKRALETYFEITTIAHPLPQMINLISCLGQGLPERFPELDVVFQEAGIEWIPTVLFRIDDEYGMRRVEAPELEKPPSRYVKDPDGPFYFTSQPTGEADDTEHVAQIIDMFNGTENLMFASDWPHYDYDTPGEFFGTVNGHLEPRGVRNIFGETAVELLDL